MAETEEERINRVYKEVAVSRSMLAQTKTFIPTPTPADFEFGEIRRFFTQQSNKSNGEIIEISKGRASTLSRKSLFTVVSLRWKVSGPERNLVNPDTGNVDVFGVREANQAAIAVAAKTIPSLPRKLTNLTQLWRGF